MDGEEGGDMRKFLRTPVYIDTCNGGSDLVYGVEKNGGLVNARGNNFKVLRFIVHDYMSSG
ncbi:unnamed protein product [Brassica oleracea var. botrytis]|nr:hypothetical protein Bca52824_071911 [Brassica carinata]CAF1991587.1 unnamed protein product [Brassica napus]CDY38983.1 BnaC07g18370D [Brassica napus]VDD37820.1 unnamed protein product [Brassica oleracea]